MKFSPGDAIRLGWETFKGRPWFFIGAVAMLLLASIAINIVSNAIDSATGGSLEEPSIAGSIVNYGLTVLLNMGAIAFFLAAYDSPDRVQFSALWHPQPYWKFLGASLLASLAVAVGLFLLIVPGLIAMVLFMFSMFQVIDRGLGPIDALKESMEMTKGNRWPLFGLILLMALILFVGILALGVGLVVAAPIVGLAYTFAYRFLSGGAAHIQPADGRIDV